MFGVMKMLTTEDTITCIAFHRQEICNTKNSLTIHSSQPKLLVLNKINITVYTIGVTGEKINNQ